MVDISDTLLVKSDRICADDLLAGDLIITVTKADKFTEDTKKRIKIWNDVFPDKCYIPTTGMARAIAMKWGKDSDNWIGKQLQLYREPTVIYAQKEVGGVEVRNMSHIPESFTFMLKVSKYKSRPHTIGVIKGGEVTVAKKEPKKEVVKDEKFEALKEAGYKAAEGGYDVFVVWGKALSQDDRAIIQTELPAMTTKSKSVMA